METSGIWGAAAAGLLIFAAYLLVRRIEMMLILLCVKQLLDRMPWNQWRNYEEVAALTSVPRRYLRRALWALVLIGVVEHDADPRLSRDEAYAKQALAAAAREMDLNLMQFRRIIRRGGGRVREERDDVLPDFGTLLPKPVRA